MSLYRVGEQAADWSGLVRIPFMRTTLCAGFPSSAEDFTEGALELPRWLAPNPAATFIWRVRGWCMKGAGIHDQDLAVVDRSLHPSPGAVVVAIVNGEMSLKRLVLDGNRLALTFDNPEMPAFGLEDLEECQIWGVLLFSVRWHHVRPSPLRWPRHRAGRRQQLLLLLREGV
ncbi:LexA family protein [Methylobacterium nodulans]|uniref:Peptidase S24 and S26 domain protein n=1 Tax=Methylobacterium nodulans (strain LMG 21967 / CNCM I-2342 / ORS 2060) TaxID=460265 RepID=B8IDM4_METNO|nr:S24 family peptidase [Methylobacterium nodulans]ACL55596.1 peptidase S24 and S26 domain protein [Methylobacterium nodulans ORS 2060]